MEKEHKFSLFYDTEKGIKNTTPKQAIDFKRLVAIYKSDKVNQLTNQLRTATAEDKPRIKLQLPFFTPYGTFTHRNNESITHHNSNLIALDFDNLDRPNAEKIKRKLKMQSSCLLCVISPRGNGVKALVLSSDTRTPENNYNVLKLNADNICGGLGIYEYKDYCDKAQFVLCQPMFIAYDKELYYNEDATAKNFNLKQYEPPTIEHQARTIIPPSFTNNRIDRYLLNATEKLYNELLRTPEGNRHHSIIKVQKIASWIHYAPHLESEIKNHLQSAVVFMYGGQRTAIEQNGIKSFAEAWNKAPINTNPTIETIIHELNTATL
jgi:hypothetical protein